MESRSNVILNETYSMFDQNGTSAELANRSDLYRCANDYSLKDNAKNMCFSNEIISDSSQNTLLDVHKGRPIRLHVKVLVPVQDHPNFNFVGKLLGPKGNSLKWLQEQTLTKIAILGKGSMRDKEKEEELRKTGDSKYAHLNEELHVDITAFAPAPEAYSRIGHALHEVKRFLVPDYYDEIRQQQLRELGILNCDKKVNSKATTLATDFIQMSNGKECPHSISKCNLRCKELFVASQPCLTKTPKILHCNTEDTLKSNVHNVHKEFHHAFNINEENESSVFQQWNHKIPYKFSRNIHRTVRPYPKIINIHSFQ